MKKLLIPSLICLSITSLISCGPTSGGKYRLTYGTYEANDALQIHYGDLSSKMIDGENMLVVTYQGDDSTCGCWRTFDAAIKGLVKEEHYLFYKIDYTELIDNKDFGLAYMNDRPALNFVKDGEVIESILYDVKGVDPLFKSKNALKTTIHERCLTPNYYLMPALKQNKDGTSIDEAINNDETFIVCYYASSCGDCKYSFPNVLFPYGIDKDFKIPMYMVNLEVEGVQIFDNKVDKSNPKYQEYKNNHALSVKGNATYGYQEGVVPSFHYYENGELKDASVFFNDKIVKEGASYKVAESFYSAKRKESLHYLDNVETQVLEGLTLTSEDVSEIDYKGQTFMLWNQDSAVKYHQPLLEAFLNKYAI